MKKNKEPVITIFFIAVNVILFIIMELIGDTFDTEYMYSVGAMYPTSIYVDHEYWRFFTANYMHFGFEHIVNNMIVLIAVGNYGEKALGHVKYAVLYVLSGIGGSILSYVMMLRKNDFAVSAGASGAIFGIFGALLWVIIVNKGRFEDLSGKGVMFMIALALYYGISAGGADNWGHLGGLLTGVVVSIILYRKEPLEEEAENVDFVEENQYTKDI